MIDENPKQTQPLGWYLHTARHASNHPTNQPAKQAATPINNQQSPSTIADMHEQSSGATPIEQTGQSQCEWLHRIRESWQWHCVKVYR
jgi:hypothetical protein